MNDGNNFYFCAHCGQITKTHHGAVVHLDTCTIGADERLNKALTALVLARDMLIANDAYGKYTAEVVDGELASNGAAMLYGSWPISGDA